MGSMRHTKRRNSFEHLSLDKIKNYIFDLFFLKLRRLYKLSVMFFLEIEDVQANKN